MLSVIIPTLNEMKNGYLQKIFPLLRSFEDQIEVICIDSFSVDGTKELIREYGFKMIQTDTTSRARRLNIGTKVSKGSLILLHHPRSIVEQRGIQYLIDHEKELTWGGFTHKFDHDHLLLRFTSWYSNSIRFDRKGIIYLDHCFFAQKALLEQVEFLPEIDIFEDTELSNRLLSVDAPERLIFYALTSATRFLKRGIWKQAINNQKLKIQYFLNTDHKQMNKDYERDVDLNSKY